MTRGTFYRRGESLTRGVGVLCAALMGIAGVSPVAAQAATGSECDHVDLTVQPRVVMATKAREVKATVLPHECWKSGLFDYRWEGYATNGVSQERVVWAQFTPAPFCEIVDPIWVTDTLHLGVWTWKPTHSTSDGKEVLPLSALNSPTMDVRLGSVSYVAASRSGGKVTISTRAYRWWQSTHAFGTWGLSTGIIQSRPAGSTGAWTNLKNVYSDNYGRYSYTWTTSSSRQYRVVMWDSTYVWGNTSANTATG